MPVRPLPRRRLAPSLFLIVTALALLAIPRLARADTVQAAIGSKPLTLSDGRVACAPPGGGWSVEPSSFGRAVRPPSASDAVGKVVELKVASSLGACGKEFTVLD